MKQRLIPVVAVVLAVGWCLAQALASPFVAAVVAAAAIASTCAVGGQRRTSPGLALATAILFAVLLAVELTLLTAHSDPFRLWFPLAAMLLLAAVAPVVYAITFPDDGEGP